MEKNSEKNSQKSLKFWSNGQNKNHRKPMYMLARTIKISDYVWADNRAESNKRYQMIFYHVEILQGKIKSVKNPKNSLNYKRKKEARIAKNGCLYWSE